MGEFFDDITSGAPTEWITNGSNPRYNYLYQSQVLTELEKYPNNDMGNQQPSNILFIVTNTLTHLAAKRPSGCIDKFLCPGQKRVWIPWSLEAQGNSPGYHLWYTWCLQGAPWVLQTHTSHLRFNEAGCISGYIPRVSVANEYLGNLYKCCHPGHTGTKPALFKAYLEIGTESNKN